MASVLWKAIRPLDQDDKRSCSQGLVAKAHTTDRFRGRASWLEIEGRRSTSSKEYVSLSGAKEGDHRCRSSDLDW
jgi:hypothetical protein